MKLVVEKNGGNGKILTMKQIVFFSLLVIIAFYSTGQSSIKKGLSAINENTIKGQLQFLASDWMEGRAVGTKGAELSSEYIASMFQVFGVEPFGDKKQRFIHNWFDLDDLDKGSSYFQNFNLLEYRSGDDHKLSVITKNNEGQKSVDFKYKTDFDVDIKTVGVSGAAPIVFVGYGFSKPKEGYDDLAKINLDGKIALILEGFPGHNDTLSVAYDKFYKGLWYKRSVEKNKYKNLQKKGAIAVIRVGLHEDPPTAWAINYKSSFASKLAENDFISNPYYSREMILPEDSLDETMPVFSVTPRVANEIIAGTGIDLTGFEEKVKNDLRPSTCLLKGKMVEFKAAVDSKMVTTRNVLGYIEGENKDELVVVGAHYDHVGKYNGKIYNGADDNASGTVGVMTIAKAFSESGIKPKRSIVFAAWASEENGLYGSKYFVKNLPDGINVVYYLNFDMIGRDAKKDSAGVIVELEYPESYLALKDMANEANSKCELGLDISFKPLKSAGGGSDHSSFGDAGIPFSFYMAAMHPDYHMPTDEVGKINWKKLTAIIKLGFLNVWEVANSEGFLEGEE